MAFSCKERGFCPSCGARRMSESAALLVFSVILVTTRLAIEYLGDTWLPVVTKALDYEVSAMTGTGG